MSLSRTNTDPRDIAGHSRRLLEFIIVQNLAVELCDELTRLQTTTKKIFVKQLFESFIGLCLIHYCVVHVERAVQVPGFDRLRSHFGADDIVSPIVL